MDDAGADLELDSGLAGTTIVSCTFEEHATAILAILNEAILNSTALYDYQPRPLSTMRGWFDAKRQGDFPVLGAVDGRGVLRGFASYGPFRAFPAYKYTVEHSVYVDKAHRGAGVGRLLLTRVIHEARLQEKHVLVGAIDHANAPSIALHRSLGFTHAGTVQHAGFKFGHWLDLDLYQLILPTPVAPQDG